MSYEDQICKISRMENGFEVEVCDPKICKSNKDSKSSYKDPWRSFAFKTTEEVLSFLKANLEKLTPPKDDFGTSFDRAIKETK